MRNYKTQGHRETIKHSDMRNYKAYLTSQVVQRQVVLYLAGWGILGVEERVPVGVSSIWLGWVSWRVEEGGLPVAVDKDLTELRFSHNSASTLAHNSYTPPGGNHELQMRNMKRPNEPVVTDPMTQNQINYFQSISITFITTPFHI